MSHFLIERLFSQPNCVYVFYENVISVGYNHVVKSVTFNLQDMFMGTCMLMRYIAMVIHRCIQYSINFQVYSQFFRIYITLGSDWAKWE